MNLEKLSVFTRKRHWRWEWLKRGASLLEMTLLSWTWNQRSLKGLSVSVFLVTLADLLRHRSQTVDTKLLFQMVKIFLCWDYYFFECIPRRELKNKTAVHLSSKLLLWPATKKKKRFQLASHGDIRFPGHAKWRSIVVIDLDLLCLVGRLCSITGFVFICMHKFIVLFMYLS